ncbi:iron ABC transporter permease [Sphaerochaeta sp. PS]|uniref:ABC transporter permease n=1 Tax=Sphaerochaeta sp. PS TaxID=3076336 RepID=UPI0028A581A4|nr:iron ABC transporter permease [Sphaerochaeta sp. PS]MDT4763309.1 iron ABC transporter permease [Sphaerochaeta sp. PS]
MKQQDGGQYKGFYKAMPAPGAAVLLLLFLVPLFFTLSTAFLSEEGFTLSRVQQTFTSAYTIRILLFTLYQAALSTLASVVVALPGAYLLANYSFRGKRFIRALTTVPFVIPSILVVLGFVIFFGNNGFLNQFLMKTFSLEKPPIQILYSFKAIILAHTFFNFPIIMNLVSSYWEHMDMHCEMAAWTLGARKGKTFRTITLPRLLPSIISASTLVFLFCYNSFAIILVLGGGPQFTTMEVEIYRLARTSMDSGAAASLSLFSILVTSFLLIWYNKSQKMLARSEAYTTSTKRLDKRPATVAGKVLALLYSLATSLFILGPIASIVVRSFMASTTRSGAESFSFRWYRQLFAIERGTGHMGSALQALTNSLAIATIVALITVPIALTMATAIRKKGFASSSLELFGMLPMTVSSVIIGLGYYIISNRIRGGVSIGYTLVVLAHMVIAIPFVLRTILPEYRKMPLSYAQSSLTLGAGPLRTFFLIEVPLLKGAMITGGMFAFALSMGEINATLTLANSAIVTLPVVMYRLIGSYNFQGACALGSVLILVCSIVFIVSELAKGESNGR